MRLFSYIFLFLLTTWQLIAQTYPVQVVPMLTPPYSSKIADYANPMANRVQLQLITTDLSVQNRSVQLYVEIKGNGLTAASAPVLSGVSPLRINGGEILRLTNAELASYFQLRNLQGITSQQYTSALPDGMYSFCFRVKDVLSGRWLSQSHCAIAYLMLNDPPILNIPTDNEQVAVTDFQNIIFSWTPRQINATNITYSFELREILDPALDPRFAFEVSRRILKEDDLRMTTFVYDVSKPNLIPGRRYAWRVRAISTGGLAENSIFKNNGYSEVHSFVYAVNCSKPLFLLSQQQGKNRTKLLWQGHTLQQKYHIQYRKKGVANAQWFEASTRNTQTLITDLEAGEYEFRVGATCETERYGINPSYVYSDIQTFKIEKTQNTTESAYNCGIVPKIAITNQKPLGSLVTNEVFVAGDFSVTILEVSGSNGIFSGKGFIKVPYLNDTKLAVEFENVKVNADYQLTDGIVKTTYDSDWKGVQFAENLIGQGEKSKDIDVPFEIEKVETRNGEIVVIGKDGRKEVFPFAGNDSSVKGKVTTTTNGVTTTEEKIYHIDKDGKVSTPQAVAQGGKPTKENTNGVTKEGEVTALTAKGIEVTFENTADSKYAYEVPTKAYSKDYQKMDGKYIPFKAVVKDQTEPFLAKVHITDKNISADSLIFKTDKGALIESKRVEGSNDFLLTLKGFHSFAVEQVQATIKQGKKYQIAGVFNLVHLSPKEVNVALVPTQSGQNFQEAIAQLQQIYEKVGVTLHITTENPFDISDQLKNGTLPTENEFGDLSTYSPEQNAVIAKFTTNRKPKESTYYIFLVDDGTGDHGYMRLGGQYGFVHTANARTIAHELGHGIFKLEHPFKSKNADKGKTSALMDYNQGQDFFYRDWKQINDPKVKLYAFQKQSEGRNVGKGHAHYVCIDDNLRKILYDKGYHFYNIKGEPIELSAQDLTTGFMGEEEGIYYGRLGIVNHKGAYHFYVAPNHELQGYYVNNQINSKFLPQKGNEGKAVWVKINNKGEYLIENSDKTISVKGKTEIVDCLSFITIKSAEQKLSNSLLGEGISEETIKLFLGKGLSADSAEYKEIESFAKYLSTILKGKKWGFLYKSKNDYEEHYGESLFLNVLKDKKIFSEKAFKESFVIRLSEKDKPYYIKDVDLLISNFDPWEGIPEYYNVYSFDYTTFNIPNLDSEQVIDELLNTLEIVLNSSLDACPKCLTQEQKETLEAFIAKRRTKEGKKFILTNKLKERNNFIAAFQLLGAYDRYYYSIKDLEKRSFLADNNWLGEISRREKAGQASAIDIQGGHSQYVAYYGTTSAFFLGFQYFKMYGDLLALDILGKVVNKAQFLNKGFKKRLNLYKSKKSISDSKPKENISSQEIENYAESLDNLNDNYKRIIQESETLRNVEWVKGRKTSGDAVNYYLHKNSYNPEDFKPPYKANSMVEDVTINKGEKIYCIEYLDAKKPGGWLTDRSFNTLDEVRNKLALIEDFKSSEKTIVIREYRVIKPFNTRKGIVGEQYEIKGINAGKEYEGGANQIEFGKYNPYDPTNSNPIWRDYLQNTSKVTTQGSEPYLKILE